MIFKGKYFDLISNSLNLFLKEMFGEQSGEYVCSRGGPGPPFFLDQTAAQRAEKCFGGRPPPPYLRVWMTAPPPPFILRSESSSV